MHPQKTVVVTGASQGIGAGLTNTFLKHGYNVVATSRRVSRSEEVKASDRLARLDGDIADPTTAKAVVETALGRFGTIDYSDESPLLFLGEAVDFDALQLKNLREFEGWR